MSLKSTNQLVFTVDTDCVNCEIGTEILHIVLILVSIQRLSKVDFIIGLYGQKWKFSYNV